MKTLVIIPAYNEAPNIVHTVESLKAACPDVDYVVVNDCSGDDTAKICEEHGYTYLNLPINLGIGGGMQTGYRYAAENGYDIAIQMDGDGQHNAEYIPDLIALIEKGEADLVIGSRFINKEGFQTSGMRRAGINILNTVLRLCRTCPGNRCDKWISLQRPGESLRFLLIIMHRIIRNRSQSLQ